MIFNSLGEKSFLKYQIWTVLSLLAVWIVAFCVYNPLGIFSFVSPDFVSPKKVMGKADSYLVRPMQIYFQRPEVLILGNSIAGMAFAREHFSLGEKILNGSVYGSSPYTWLRLLQNAKAVNADLKTVYLLLDLTVMDLDLYDEQKAYRNRFDQRLLYDDDLRYQPMAPLRLVHELLKQVVSVDGYEIFNSYFEQTNQDVDYVDSEGFHYYFREPVNIGLERAERILSRKRGLFDKSFSQTREHQYLKKLIQFAYNNNIELKIILPPYHVSFYQALANKDKLVVLAEWKKSLSDLNYELFSQADYISEDGSASLSMFGLYDFSRYSDLTRDQYTLGGKKSKVSSRYYDVNHFNHEVGELILRDIDGQGRVNYSRLILDVASDDLLAELQRDHKQFTAVYDR